jgi:hypothetical protein
LWCTIISKLEEKEEKRVRQGLFSEKNQVTATVDVALREVVLAGPCCVAVLIPALVY